MRTIMTQSEQWPDRVASIKEAIPEHPDRRWKEKLMDHLVQQHESGEPMGFTLRDELGDGPTSGTMVSHPPMGDRDKDNKGVPLSDVTAEDLAALSPEERALIESDPDNYRGAWVEDDPDDPYGRLFMDVSERIEEPHDAIGLGVDREQLAIMDLDKVDAHGKPLDSAFLDPVALADRGLANALGLIQGKRRRR